MKIPHDAFEYYMSLGAGRSYEAVAQKYGASKRAVVTRASREHWQKRAAERDRVASELAARKSGESHAAARERQLKVVRTIQTKALETLRAMSLNSAIDAVRALDLSLKQERVILGDPQEVTSDSLEETIRSLYDRWTRPGGDADPARGKESR